MYVWKVDKADCVVKPKARLVARVLSRVRTVGVMGTYSPILEVLFENTMVPVAV